MLQWMALHLSMHTEEVPNGLNESRKEKEKERCGRGRGDPEGEWI